MSLLMDGQEITKKKYSETYTKNKYQTFNVIPEKRDGWKSTFEYNYVWNEKTSIFINMVLL